MITFVRKPYNAVKTTSLSQKPNNAAQVQPGHPLAQGLIGSWVSLTGPFATTRNNISPLYTASLSVASSFPGKKSDGRINFSAGNQAYLNIGINAIGPYINGASTLLVDAIFTVNSFMGSGVRGRVFNLGFGAGVTSFILGTFNNAGTLTLECAARSTTGDGLQSAQFGYSTTGQRVHMMGFVDFLNSTIKIYFNGLLVTTLAATFGAKFYTHTTATGLNDGMCGDGQPSNYFDGAFESARLWKNFKFKDSHARQLFESPYCMFKSGSLL